jgi:hypothetical protein
MLERNLCAVIVLAIALASAGIGASAADQPTFPDWRGQWVRIGGTQFDPSKPAGRGQEAALTAEYQARFEAAIVTAASGGPPADPTLACFPAGMPRTMIAAEPMEILITPKTTYVFVSYPTEFRRISTDGQGWPDAIEPSFTGYSIGKWQTGADGKYESLVVETRSLKGPRTFDASGLPLHQDAETVVKERIYLDKGNPNLLHDEITTSDHALTRPWTVTRTYHRERNPRWVEHLCAVDNRHVLVDGESYLVSEDGYLMPTRKGQKAPDLTLFKQPGK